MLQLSTITLYSSLGAVPRPAPWPNRRFPARLCSGAGLHVGHPEGYTATDIVSRYKRMRGYNVLHPMGWDAFGLPAEQYAIQTGTHPAVTTDKNIDRFRQQVGGTRRPTRISLALQGRAVGVTLPGATCAVPAAVGGRCWLLLESWQITVGLPKQTSWMLRRSVKPLNEAYSLAPAWGLLMVLCLGTAAACS